MPISGMITIKLSTNGQMTMTKTPVKHTGITSAATIQRAFTTKTSVNLTWKICRKLTPWLLDSRAMITA